MSRPGVKLVSVQKRFGDRVAVRSLDIFVPEGSFFSVIGPSGCGKTTTLRIVAGLENPDAGRVEIDGEDVTHIPAHRRPVNTVFQSYALFPHLDVYENIAFGLREERRPRAEIARKVGEMMELVRLSGRERSRSRELSGGEQQRVALARALVKRPRVLLLDEPLGSLDLRLRTQMQVELKDVQRKLGVTFFYVTHDQEEAFSMSDQVAVMNAGMLDQVGVPEAIYRTPASLFVAEFVGTTNRLPGRIDRVLPDGSFAVDAGVGDVVQAAGPATLRRGDRVSVVIRPEDLSVTTPATERSGERGFLATVEDISYLGSHRQVRLRTARLGVLVARLGAHGDPIREGEERVVSWTPSVAWLVPRQAAAAEQAPAAPAAGAQGSHPLDTGGHGSGPRPEG